MSSFQFTVEIEHNVILVYGTVVARTIDGLFFWEGDPFETSGMQVF